MRDWIIAAGLLAAATGQAQAQGSFCAIGSALIPMGKIGSTNVQALYNSCSAGDSILIPSVQTFIIARVCDFSQQVIVSGGTLICVMTNLRPMKTE